MGNNNESSEKLYDSLTKAFESTIYIIKHAVYPTAALLTIIIGFSIWWGIDIRNSKSEILSTKNEIDNIHKSLSLKAREIVISSREIESDTKIRYDALAAQFTQFESNFKQMNTVFKDLRNRYEKALSKNELLFKELKADNKSLTEFSDTIKSTIAKHTNEIAYARKGIEQRKKDIESILKKRNEQLDAASQTLVYLTEYLVLVQTGRNKTPDPNKKREINLINKMIYTLVPDKNQRNRIIKRIHESTNR